MGLWTVMAGEDGYRWVNVCACGHYSSWIINAHQPTATFSQSWAIWKHVHRKFPNSDQLGQKSTFSTGGIRCWEYSWKIGNNWVCAGNWLPVVEEEPILSLTDIFLRLQLHLWTCIILPSTLCCSYHKYRHPCPIMLLIWQNFVEKRVLSCVVCCQPTGFFCNLRRLAVCKRTWLSSTSCVNLVSCFQPIYSFFIWHESHIHTKKKLINWKGIGCIPCSLVELNNLSKSCSSNWK